MFVRVYAQEGMRIPTSFEQFMERISKWRGMHAESDGSFVWVYFDGLRRRQLDGMVYDREGALEYVELKGALTVDSVSQLLKAITGDRDPNVWDYTLRVHAVDDQYWMSVDEFVGTVDTEGDLDDAE